jgi:hypothetical protein
MWRTYPAFTRSATAPTVFDRHLRIEARGSIDVDDVDAEALQTIRGERLHRGRASVHAEPAPVRPPERAEFHRNLHLVAHPFDAATDEKLVVAHAVEVARVDERHAPLDGAADGGEALGLVRFAVNPRHTHAPQPDREHPGARLSQRNRDRWIDHERQGRPSHERMHEAQRRLLLGTARHSRDCGRPCTRTAPTPRLDVCVDFRTDGERQAREIEPDQQYGDGR